MKGKVLFFAMVLAAQAATASLSSASQLPVPAQSSGAAVETSAIATRSFETEVAQGSSLSKTLRTIASFDGHDVHNLVLSCASTYDLARIPAATRITVSFSNYVLMQPDRLDFELGPTKILQLRRTGEETWDAAIRMIPTQSLVVAFAGTIEDSFWNSARESSMDASVVMKFAAIFAWEVDFNRELRRGNRWRLAIEEKFVNHKRVGWGDILVAEFEGTDQTFTAIRYDSDASSQQYFHPDGSSVRRIFLKSPVEFGRVSSRFSKQRLHPVTNVTRPHQGVDYAAPTGTPILAVGDGRVSEAGHKGDSGLMLKVRHNSFYTTAYKHMSKLAKGVAVGSQVRQGQVIGYVGMTGLATGPHVHFELHENGKYIDPLGVNLPSADPIPSPLMGDFIKVVDKRLRLLPQWVPGPIASVRSAVH